MKVLVLVTDDNSPSRDTPIRKIQDADVVLLRHRNGTFSLYKDRWGECHKRVSWDSLPTYVKRAVKL